MGKELTVLVFVIGLPLAFVAAGVIHYFEEHPRPLREWRLWHGPLEACPRCKAAVPLGWIAYSEAEYNRRWKGSIFGDLDFYRRIDGSYIMIGWGIHMPGGRTCGICDTHWPDGSKKPKRPLFFEYGRNADFGLPPERTDVTGNFLDWGGRTQPRK